jgi:hypothetical protein
MTPIAGFIIAVVAGWLVRDGRRATALVVIPWLGVLAVQTWILAAGDGVSPPSTVSQFPQAIGYWAVQAGFLAFPLGIAAMLGSLRARDGLPGDLTGRLDSIKAQTAITAAILAVATTVFLASAVLTAAPVRHHSAEGTPPLIGFVGMALCVTSFAALSVVSIWRYRARNRRFGTETASVTTNTAAR